MPDTSTADASDANPLSRAGEQADQAAADLATPAESAEVVFYWRPGCGFCSMLRRGLQRAGLTFREVDIWEHPEGAAYVRSVARGNETVPTLDVAGVGMVNPTVGEVLAVVAERAPALVPDQPEQRHFWQRG